MNDLYFDTMLFGIKINVGYILNVTTYWLFEKVFPILPLTEEHG